VFGIPLDRFDHQIELVGAVDFPGHAVKAVVADDLGFAEVIEPIEALGVVLFHEEDNTGAVFHALDQSQVIGAEVKHGVPWEDGRKCLYR